jgi:hypothetical protein
MTSQRTSPLAGGIEGGRISINSQFQSLKLAPMVRDPPLLPTLNICFLDTCFLDTCFLDTCFHTPYSQRVQTMPH